ncbi:MAG: hypothetical protein RL710_2404, partial [Pseudomonadota bacterium]
AGDQVLQGDAGNNWIYGAAGNDKVYGGDGNDELGGDKGNDELFGEGGDDTLFGEEGADQMTGGAGNDIYYVDDLGDTTTETASGGTDTVMAGLNWTLASEVEQLTLTGTRAINGTGNTVANVIAGNGGNNLSVLKESGSVTIEALNATELIAAPARQSCGTGRFDGEECRQKPPTRLRLFPAACRAKSASAKVGARRLGCRNLLHNCYESCLHFQKALDS